MRAICAVLTISIFLILSGCSTGPASPVEPQTGDSAGVITAGTTDNFSFTNRYLWGYWDIMVCEDNTEIIYNRAAAAHFNPVRLLEVTPCSNCLTIENVIFHPDNEVQCDLRIRHPFSGYTKYTGFDVRGILVTMSDHNFPVSDRWIAYGNDLPKLLNADGYTTLFNPTEFPEGSAPFPVLGYIQGKYSAYTGLTSTLNPFIAYKKEAPRRIFLSGEASSETLHLHSENHPFEFGYAVDASWVPVDGTITDPLNQFPPEANSIEPYMIEIDIDTENLTSGIGSQALIDVRIYDHQGLDTIGQVTVECDALFGGLITLDYVDSTEFFHNYHGVIINSFGASIGTYPVLVKAESLTPDFNLGEINAWNVTEIEISQDVSSPPVALALASIYTQAPDVPIDFMDDGSYDPDGGALILYEWDFDEDGIYEETGTSVQHSWSDPGTYLVQFRVTDEELETDTLDEPIEILIDPGLGNLTGAIKDGVNNLPIDGATAETWDGGYQSDTTEDDGIYFLGGLPPGEIEVQFSADGYVPAMAYFEIIGGETTTGDVVLMAPQGDSGNLTGTARNAQDFEPIEGVHIILREGINNVDGTIIDETDSDELGEFAFNDLPAGTYTMYGEKDGYDDNWVNGVCVPNDTTHYDLIMSPILGWGEIRIVLTWDLNPDDLDSHLLTPEIEGDYYHIYFVYKGSLDFPPYAELDWDDVTSYGPETVTIGTVFPDKYKYYVHHWAGSGSISTTSNAIVKIYNWSGYVTGFHAPQTGEEGLWWEVFDFYGDTDEIVPIDEIRQYEPEWDD